MFFQLLHEKIKNKRCSNEPQKVYIEVEPEIGGKDEEIEAEVEELAGDLTKIQALVSGSHTVISFFICL